MSSSLPPDSEDDLLTPIPKTNSRAQSRRNPLPPPSSSPNLQDAALATSSETTTPIANLRKLASISQSQSQPQPPSSIASSIGSRLAERTALRNARRPAAATTSAINTRRNDGMPTTPHAIRAMEERRRVAMTPSRERRRASGRGAERGSPFNILQALSKIAAVPVAARKEDEQQEDEDEDEEEEEEAPSVGLSSDEESDELPKPPRLSLSMNEMRLEGEDADDDDTGIFRPPEMSHLDEDITLKSVEAMRRAEPDASILTRRGIGGRLSDFSGLFDDDDDGKTGLDDTITKRVASPSFVTGELGLSGEMGIGDETIDFGRVTTGRGTTSPLGVLGRDIDLADPTFQFDIPQDITEAVSTEDVDEENDGGSNDIEPVAASINNDPPLVSDDSGPEEFGSPSASEIREDNAIDEDENIGMFLDDEAQENEISDDEDAEADDGGEIKVDAMTALSRKLDEQSEANKIDDTTQLRSGIQEASVTEDLTRLASQLGPEEPQEPLIPRPPIVQTVRQQVSRPAAAKPSKTTKRAPKQVAVSKHGQKVPSLPAGVVKSLADTFLPHAGKNSKKTKKDTVAALSQATDWFFEQVAEDLDAYSKHADRDVIEEADVVALMKRQRVLATGAKNVQGNRSAAPGSSRATLFSLAQRFLPRELMTELRMDPPPDERRKKRRRISEGGEFD